MRLRHYSALVSLLVVAVWFRHAFNDAARVVVRTEASAPSGVGAVAREPSTPEEAGGVDRPIREPASLAPSGKAGFSEALYDELKAQPLSGALKKLLASSDLSSSGRGRAIGAYLMLQDQKERLLPDQRKEASLRLIGELSKDPEESLDLIQGALQESARPLESGTSDDSRQIRVDLYQLVSKLPATENREIHAAALEDLRFASAQEPKNMKPGVVYDLTNQNQMQFSALQAFMKTASRDSKETSLEAGSAVQEGSTNPFIRYATQHELRKKYSEESRH